MSLQTQINASGLLSEVPTVFSPTPIGPLPVTTGQIQLSNVGAVSVGATPSVSTTDVLSGTKLTIFQTGSGTTTLSDNATLPGSMLKLQAATRILSQNQVLVLVFDGTYWCEESCSAAGGGGSGIIPFNANIDNSATSLLLHMNGTNGGTTFIDNGFYGYVVNASGAPFATATTSTTQFKYGGSSGLFVKSSVQGLRSLVSSQAGGSAPFTMSTGDFTVEAWVWMNSVPGAGYPSGFWIMGWGDNAADYGFDFYLTTTNLCFNTTYYSAPQISAAHGMSINQWYHVAVSRSGNNFRGFVNGAQIGSTTIANPTAALLNTGAIAIGTAEPTTAGGEFDGYLQDVCITKGVAKYTSNFTPPAALLPNGYDPSYLPSSPVAGQLALSSSYIYACTNATGPVWKRAPLSST